VTSTEAAGTVVDQAPAAGEGDPTGTRERIQAVALELFTEQGYDATSLREISERLGVTKAALYYHFRTKEDIIASLIADRIARLDELVDWSRVQPPTAENRRDLLRRYSELLYANGYDKLVRFIERNQSSLGHRKLGPDMRERMLELAAFLSGPDEPLTTRLRCSMALFALHAGLFVALDPEATMEEQRAAALEVALDLIER